MLIWLSILACGGGAGDGPQGDDTAATDDTQASTDDTSTDDTSTDDTGDDTGTVSAWTVTPLVAPIGLEADEGGVISPTCQLAHDGVWVSEDAADSVDVTVSIAPMDGVSETEGGWSVETYGTYTVTCDATVDGVSISGSADVIVVTEVLAPELAAWMGTVSEIQAAHIDVAVAQDGQDAAMVAAIERLTAAVQPVPGDLSVFRTLPEGYWPTPEQLTAEGVTRSADDDALAAALTAWGDALRAVDTALVGLDPLTLTEDQLAELQALDAAAMAAGDALVALEPTAHGWLENAALLDTELIAPAAQLNLHTAQFTEARLRSDAAEILPPFGLVGLAMGAVNVGGIRGLYLKHVIAPVVEQLDLSINNMILMGLIEYLAPGDGSMEITHIQASASVSYAVPGYPTTIYGSGMAEGAGQNLFLVVGVDWQEAVGTILDGCGIEDGDTVPEIADDIAGCIETVEEAVEDSQATGGARYNDAVWGQAVDIGPFPDVCGSGWVPVTVGIMGINQKTGGRTEGFYQLSCLP